jgi:uncharacterized protein (DUF1778 family)
MADALPETIRLTVKILPEEKALLERAARRAGDCSISAVVRKLIRDALADKAA